MSARAASADADETRPTAFAARFLLGQGKSIARLNGGESNLTLNHFSVGTMVQMPDLLPDEIHVVDADVARYFFHTEHDYPAAIQRIEQAIDALGQAVRQPIAVGSRWSFRITGSKQTPGFLGWLRPFLKAAREFP